MKLSSCIVQEEPRGCAVACVATILDKPYWEVRKHFDIDLGDKSGEGISQELTSNYLSGYGFTAIFKAWQSFTSYDEVNAELLRPFAPIHIVSLQQSVNSELGHAIIMDEEGNLFDPEDGKKFDRDFLQVNSIFGFWYPKGWEFKQ